MTMTMYVHMYACLVPPCKPDPMTAPGAHPPEVPNVAGNTQANDTLPSMGARGVVSCRIRPRPHTKLFGGAPAPLMEKLPKPSPIPSPPEPRIPPPRGDTHMLRPGTHEAGQSQGSGVQPFVTEAQYVAGFAYRVRKAMCFALVARVAGMSQVLLKAVCETRVAPPLHKPACTAC